MPDESMYNIFYILDNMRRVLFLSNCLKNNLSFKQTLISHVQYCKKYYAKGIIMLAHIYFSEFQLLLIL